MVVCIALGVDDVSRGSLLALIYPGDRVTWKSKPGTVGILLQHNRVVSFVLQLVLRLFG